MPPFALVPSRPDRRHYIIQKAKAAEGERDRRAISIHAPISTFPQADGSDGGDVPILPDPRRTDADGCAARQAEAIHAFTESCMGQSGQREGLDGWSHNELGLETTLGPADPISGRQSDEDEFKI